MVNFSELHPVSDDGILVRTASPADAIHLCRLFEELGFPIDAGSIASKWEEWSRAGHGALVALLSDGSLAGAITFHRTIVLHRSYPIGRITALIVGSNFRGRGIGKKLVMQTEWILAQAGCQLLEVTSNFRLSEAHSFYEHLGYQRTSFRFAKEILP